MLVAFGRWGQNLHPQASFQVNAVVFRSLDPFYFVRDMFLTDCIVKTDGVVSFNLLKNSMQCPIL